jgi:hypothetical protein
MTDKEIQQAVLREVVFYTEAWDVGPGETSSFPTKWMRADGKTLYLVFSCVEAFSIAAGGGTGTRMANDTAEAVWPFRVSQTFYPRVQYPLGKRLPAAGRLHAHRPEPAQARSPRRPQPR